MVRLQHLDLMFGPAVPTDDRRYGVIGDRGGGNGAYEQQERQVSHDESLRFFEWRR
jgi:hypothetical protein